MNYEPALYSTIFSLLPALLAITLALVTKEVYSSLFLGILAGALLYAGGNLELAYNTLLFNEEGGLIPNIANISHASILVFCALLFMLVEILNRSGAVAAFGRFATSKIKSRVGTQLAAILLGVLIFVDDGFNCMTVGSVMRPISDRQKISRAKLAYIIDSTAAPVCIIAPISSWAAAVTSSVPESMGINGFAMFVKLIPYNLYALLTLGMMLFLVTMKVDFGPMKKSEEKALAGDVGASEALSTDAPSKGMQGKAKPIDLILPVALLIVTCVFCMAYTGGILDGASLQMAFADCDSPRALVMGSLFTLVFTFIFYLIRGVLDFKTFMGGIPAGLRTMCAPMIILILSWNLSGMTGLLGAAPFIHDVVEASAASLQMFLPVIIFLISVFLAFASGTSWGTFMILIPIICGVFPENEAMLLVSIAACLSGAVCGDHCSPISDTTIMSSAGAGCQHVEHVSTQLPYAITVAAVSACGYLLSGILAYNVGSGVALLATPAAFAILFGVVMIAKKRRA